MHSARTLSCQQRSCLSQPTWPHPTSALHVGTAGTSAPIVSQGTVSFNLALCSAAAAAKSLQLCPTLCNPRDGSPPGYPVPGILQARTLEWVAISFSNAWKWKVKVKSLSRVRLLATPWTAAYQAPLSMGFSRQEYWSGVPSPSPSSLLYYLVNTVCSNSRKLKVGTPLSLFSAQSVVWHRSSSPHALEQQPSLTHSHLLVFYRWYLHLLVPLEVWLWLITL